MMKDVARKESNSGKHNILAIIQIFAKKTLPAIKEPGKTLLAKRNVGSILNSQHLNFLSAVNLKVWEHPVVCGLQ